MVLVQIGCGAKENVMNRFTDTKKYVKDYYGNVLHGNKSLKTKACCCSDELMSRAALDIERQIDKEILTKFYGCGSPIPPVLEGRSILDLGCGTGKDVYIASRLAGEEGFVIGIDMTGEQLEVAMRHLDSQMKRFGYQKPNVKFNKGYIEDLNETGIMDNSIDIVISNCVINLSGEKRKVFSEVFRVLKPGGELFFSDVFAGRRVPEDLAEDPVLYSECLGGAMYIGDFSRMLRETGFPDYRIVTKKKINLENPELQAKAGMVDFYSMTVRAFKLNSLEESCEDYGQAATYLGTISGYPHAFELDEQHRFITGKPVLICGNTASMLSETRFAHHFKVTGDRSVHYGPFNCAGEYAKVKGDGEGGGTCC
jgi:ubiquinone/menaquinone biosynthesis C-methylase UbiE